VPPLAELVEAYARRIYPAVLSQHDGASVSSPLGIWLLLAACTGDAQERRLLAEFLADPPPALRAAIALWVRAADRTPELAEWAAGLPGQVEQGPMPTKPEADEWARRNTLGLIETFPLDIDDLTAIVLASALATKVSWQRPFEVTDGPWRGTVRRLLWDIGPRDSGLLVTEAAGLVAVHRAEAVEDLTVLSISAEPRTPREAVLAAAHEIAAGRGAACSLFELSLGRGHSWELEEREIGTRSAGERHERTAAATLPAWRIQSRLDLTRSDDFGANAALAKLQTLVGPQAGDELAAVQAAVAAFTRYGFEAAAVTAFGVLRASLPLLRHRGLERSLTLRFDHPYAALAISRPGSLPLFSAWVTDPVEPEAS
jgi:hypothetical protein